ncbi:hypothetical protein BDZ90DRAFT_262128 [Jaminaea rosea]|uniref:HNH endonuclease 5 domain-containing protein n=1 Tax=Jaminaea rosea TaxID=1569628 RepID=A0A316UKZ7_9BASI|nr:hypothetical protein BDZ90DRAFT_262128 [Jaminaea rosea]PWN25478.1 hypothetical protein BDZ90DRAFT_262128 [Jaminaea rosea]
MVYGACKGKRVTLTLEEEKRIWAQAMEMIVDCPTCGHKLTFFAVSKVAQGGAGEKDFHPHNASWGHVVALSRGGENNEHDEQILCRTCNAVKVAFTDAEASTFVQHIRASIQQVDYRLNGEQLLDVAMAKSPTPMSST